MKFNDWLYNKFLPDWCKDNLLERNERLQTRVAELKQENSRLNAYIDGLEANATRRITVNINGVKQ